MKGSSLLLLLLALVLLSLVFGLRQFPLEFQLHLMKILFAVYIFILGSVIGSFLNVVIYRMPIGLGLLRPGSRCPRCDSRIRALDNVPIASYLWLRGRCRHCQTEISMRYPLIELTTASAFLALASTEIFTAGGNLPLPPAAHLPFSGRFIDDVPWPLTGVFIFHCFLLAALLCHSMMNVDGQPAPGGFLASTLAIGLAAGTVWPFLRATPTSLSVLGWPDVPAWIAGAVDGVIGLVFGLLVGWMLGRASGHMVRAARPTREMAFGLGFAGVILGWLAVVSLVLFAALLRVIAAGLARPYPALGRFPPMTFIAIATFVQLFSWKLTVRFWRSYGTEGRLIIIGLTLVATFALWHVASRHLERLRTAEAFS